MNIESLGAVDAILIAISGVVTVTLMLGCLAILITLISKVVIMIESKNTPATTEETLQTQPVAEIKNANDPNVAYGGETLLIDVDEKTAACIMAIVSDETGIDLSELVFTKIRAL
ncbi:MAG: OadG family transporter subunit [Clostridia bacterium]